MGLVPPGPSDPPVTTRVLNFLRSSRPRDASEPAITSRNTPIATTPCSLFERPRCVTDPDPPRKKRRRTILSVRVALFTTRSPPVVNRGAWLRMGSRLRTRSRGSWRDGVAPLAPSRKCERLRIQVVGRCDPGHSHGFAPSRAARPTAAAATLGAEPGDKTTSLCICLKAICPRGCPGLRARGRAVPPAWRRPPHGRSTAPRPQPEDALRDA